MMNILIRELKTNIKPVIIWSLSVFVFVAMAMSEFSAYYDNPEMAAVLEMVPPQMLEAFGFGGINLTTLSGFISAIATYVYMILGVHAVLLGSSILVKEEREKTAEFLFTLPTTRGNVIIQKIIAGIFVSLAVLFFTFLGILFLSKNYNPDKEFVEFLSLLMRGTFIVQMIFYSIGLLISVIMDNYKKAGSVSIGILLFTYILSVFAGMNKNIEFLKYASPFKYFEATMLFRENAIDSVYLTISMIVISVGLILTMIVYPKKDLRI